MQLREFPLPTDAGGACFIMPANTDGRFVDTMVDNDDAKPYGRIIISEAQVAEMARLFGWATPGEVSKLRDELAEVVDVHVVVTQERDRLREMLETLIGSTETMPEFTPTEPSVADDDAVELVP